MPRFCLYAGVDGCISEEEALCEVQADVLSVAQTVLGVRAAAVQQDQQKANLKYFSQDSLSEEKEGFFSCFVHV